MMNVLEMLEQRMDRVKELMDVTGLSMEDLLAESAMVHVNCEMCPIKAVCDQFRYDESFGCTDAWTMYLKGDIDA